MGRDERRAVRGALLIGRRERDGKGHTRTREHHIRQPAREAAIAVRKRVEREQVVARPRRLGDGAEVVARADRLERGHERLSNLIPKKSPEYGKAIGKQRREREEAEELGLPAPYSGPPLFNPKVCAPCRGSFGPSASSRAVVGPGEGMMSQHLWFDYPKYSVELL